MIEYGPENQWSYFYLGSSYVGIDEFKKAEEAKLKARDLEPNFLLNQYRLAHVYRLLGKYDRAIEVLKNILHNNADEVITHYNMGINYQLMGKPELSRDQFLRFRNYAEEWEVNYSQDPQSFINLGLVLTRLGEKEAGWESGKKAIDLDSTLHFRYAEFFAVQDEKSEALDHLEKALQNGYRDLVWLKLNPDLYILHSEIRYKDLIREYFMEN